MHTVYIKVISMATCSEFSARRYEVTSIGMSPYDKKQYLGMLVGDGGGRQRSEQRPVAALDICGGTIHTANPCARQQSRCTPTYKHGPLAHVSFCLWGSAFKSIRNSMAVHGARQPVVDW
jgi:hypothetical protein